MEIITINYPLQGLEDKGPIRPKTLAIGHFDGVHKGHQSVIRRAVDVARAEGLEAAVMTFHPHPKEVLGRGSEYTTCLTPLEDKLERFRSLRVDIVYVVTFNLTFAAVSPAAFVDEMLRPLQVKRAVVGFDFSFGAKGAGRAETLRELAGSDMKVDIIEPLMMDGDKVSSTLVREALAGGRPETAEQLLGVPFSLRGTVVKGEGRGRTIGYPTANIQLAGAYVTPRLGVYAVMAELSDGERYSGVLNVGVKPTFHDSLPMPVMEVHLFDYEGDLYGSTVRISFISFLRSEKKFASVQELIEQIGADALKARSVLSAFK
ncbi:bifunctional riboflavin kinase/FAD synthetase [Paenibacillus spongiae]|uniref:Riboflavin biosynthesis protein n=1 Tax=Paenibacillus spongiae TaxID=2909671 RepID=A0ABY5SEZ4_9BACL|nr:bifunctional riboflavin kinase/FAD synthetase [Paenibacillus spongiae]UVI32546.1 bifunctional riboflavin kinase/FAD synthetase [Paenibacillus spongiae]